MGPTNVFRILPDLIFAQPLPTGNGYTWTLASRTGEILRELEQRYGARDKAFTLLGVEFRDGVPRTWFPGNCGNVIIQLDRGCMPHRVQAYYQLAHECVHLLDPCISDNAPVVEEGMAAEFALSYARRFNPTYQNNDPKYRAAANLVGKFLSNWPAAIKAIRSGGKKLHELKAADLMAECDGLDANLADALCVKFANYLPPPT
jgi:hypothetical protein